MPPRARSAAVRPRAGAVRPARFARSGTPARARSTPRRLEAEVGTSGDRRRRQDRQIGIAAGREQAKGGVERAPGVHLEAIAPEEEPFLQAADDVADDDRPDGAGEPQCLRRRHAGGEAEIPGDIPERRMQQVDAVIEDIADAGRSEGDARELAVDGVEKSHQPRGEEADAEIAAGEQPHRQQHEQQARRRHHVGGDAARRAPARDPEGGPRPQPFRHEVGDALVGGAEQLSLGGELRVRGQRKRERHGAFAQRLVIGRTHLGRTQDREVDSRDVIRCAPRLPQQFDHLLHALSRSMRRNRGASAIGQRHDAAGNLVCGPAP